MTYEKGPFEFEDIPDFALQPAKGAEEYNDEYLPKNVKGSFDTDAYEKVLYNSERREPIHSWPKDSLDQIGQNVFEKPVMPEPAPVDQPVFAEAAAEAEVDAETIPVFVPVPDAEPEAIHEADVEAVEEPDAEEVSEPEEEDEAILTIEPEVVEEPDAVPVAGPAPQPAPAPAPNEAPVSKVVPIKITPVTNVLSSKLKLVDARKKPQVRLYIEEDILVPDVKPDLAAIISIDGKIKLTEREIHTGQTENGPIKVTGDLILQTLYIPETIVDGEPMVAIDSKLPFKNDLEIKTGVFSDLVIAPTIEALDYTIINERKFKVKATIALGLREYANVNTEIFEGIRDEELQMLKEKIHLTDVALRKSETAEIKEDLVLKDTMPEVQKILKYDVNIVENHKQITKEKAVINASIYCNIMYLGTEEEEISKTEDAEAEAGKAVPVLYQGKTEFTQFIRLDNDSLAGQNPAGSRVNFNISTLNLTAKEDGNGKKTIFELDMNVETGIELYNNLEKEVVTDVYHHLKNAQFDTDEVSFMALAGSGVAEISVREIINIPERLDNVEKIAFVSGKLIEKSTYIDQGKSIVEGSVIFNLICIPTDKKKPTFSIKQEVPFRNSMEIPGLQPQMIADNDLMLKEVWFEKINNRQIEVNAGILLNTTVSNEEKHQLVRSVSFQEGLPEARNHAGIILYIARTGDNIWKIAKKYRTTIDDIRKVNDLEVGKEIKPGTKLLIVAKNH